MPPAWTLRPGSTYRSDPGDEQRILTPADDGRVLFAYKGEYTKSRATGHEAGCPLITWPDTYAVIPGQL